MPATGQLCIACTCLAARQRVSSKKLKSLCVIVTTNRLKSRQRRQIDDALRLTSKGVRENSQRRKLIILIDNSVTDYHPSKQSLPFLPKSPKCLKPGQLAKVIAKTGRVVVGRIRYCGPVAGADCDETYVGLQLPNSLGDCDGSFDGKKFFEWWDFLIRFLGNFFLKLFSPQRQQFWIVCAIQESYHGLEFVNCRRRKFSRHEIK